MNSKEIIRLIKEIKPILYCSYKEAFDRAIKAIETVDKIKQAIDKHDFPEYLEEDVIDIIDAYYKEDKDET